MTDTNKNNEVSQKAGKVFQEKKLVWLTGIMGIFGSALLAASDLLLVGRPAAGSEVFSFSDMALLPQWRITVPVLLGVIVAIPLIIAGFYQMFAAFRHKNRWWSWALFLVFAHSLILGAGYHAGYLFIGIGIKTGSAIAEAAPINEMITAFSTWDIIFRRIMLGELFFVSVLFIVAVLLKKTYYPSWMSIFSPILLMIGLPVIARFLPAPIGGYAVSTAFNGGLVLFFFLSSVVLNRNREF